jgi:hypothetical protein
MGTDWERPTTAGSSPSRQPSLHRDSGTSAGLVAVVAAVAVAVAVAAAVVVAAAAAVALEAASHGQAKSEIAAGTTTTSAAEVHRSAAELCVGSPALASCLATSPTLWTRPLCRRRSVDAATAQAAMPSAVRWRRTPSTTLARTCEALTKAWGAGV